MAGSGLKEYSTEESLLSLLANPHDFPRRLLLLIATSLFPPGITVLPYFSPFLTNFLTFSSFSLSQLLSDTVQSVEALCNSKSLLFPPRQQHSYTKPPKENSHFLRKVLKGRGMHFVKSAASVFFYRGRDKINE